MRKRGLPVLNGPAQYMCGKRKYGMILGRVLRVLDMANLEEGEVITEVGRVLLEVRGAGYSEEILRKVLRRAEREAWCDLRKLRSIPGMKPAGAKMLASITDSLRKVERRADAESRSRESR